MTWENPGAHRKKHVLSLMWVFSCHFPCLRPAHVNPPECQLWGRAWGCPPYWWGSGRAPSACAQFSIIELSWSSCRERSTHLPELEVADLNHACPLDVLGELLNYTRAWLYPRESNSLGWSYQVEVFFLKLQRVENNYLILGQNLNNSNPDDSNKLE